MSTPKKLPEKLKPKHNVQIPVEVMQHPDLDVYCLAVYAYMKLRYQYFNNFLKTTYHESNTTIADAVGASRRKVIECIGKLEKAGFVTKKIRNGSGVDKKEQTNIYTVKDCLSGSKIEKVVNKMQWEFDGDEPF
jgi:biotin operon repressor